MFKKDSTQISNEECIIDTFVNKKAIDRCKNYYHAINLGNDGKSPADIADSLGVHRTTVWQWLNKDIVPYPIKAARYLEERKLLPLTYDNPHFPKLNELASWTYWSGTISKGDKHEKKVMISSDPDKILELAEVVDGLGFGYEFGDQRDTLIISEGGSNMGRLFHCMGLPSGKKSTLDNLVIPGYITDKACPEKEIQTFLRVLFEARGYRPSTQNGYRVPLFCSKNRETAKDFLKQTKSVLRRSGKTVPVKSNIVPNRNSFMPIFYFTKENYRKMMR